METMVVYIATFEGTNCRLGRSGLVELDASLGIEWCLDRERYETIEEYTPGAISAENATALAKERCPDGVPIYYGGVFQTKRIS